MVSTRPPTSKSSSPFSNPFVTVPNAPITIGIIVSIIIIIIIILLIRVFHISVSWWFLLESEWQQVFSSHQDSSQDSGRSQQCCRLNSLYLSANFQFLQAF